MSNLTDETITLARRYAIAEFGGLSNAAELISDVISMAWQFCRNPAPAANPGSLAIYAVRQVKVYRQFAWSIRTADHPMNAEKLVRHPMEFHPSAPGDDPADIAQANIDVAAWLESLSPRMRTVADLLATGTSTQKAARLLGLSPARVSQFRAELAANYAEFTA